MHLSAKCKFSATVNCLNTLWAKSMCENKGFAGIGNAGIGGAKNIDE